MLAPQTRSVLAYATCMHCHWASRGSASCSMSMLNVLRVRQQDGPRGSEHGAHGPDLWHRAECVVQPMHALGSAAGYHTPESSRSLCRAGQASTQLIRERTHQSHGLLQQSKHEVTMVAKHAQSCPFAPEAEAPRMQPCAWVLLGTSTRPREPACVVDKTHAVDEQHRAVVAVHGKCVVRCGVARDADVSCIITVNRRLLMLVCCMICNAVHHA